MSGAALRTSERSLKLLVFNGKVKNAVQRRALASSYDLLFRGSQKSQQNNLPTKRYVSRSIKLNAGLLDTTLPQIKFPSLINPNKPNAIDLKNQELPPIVPHTHPRFSKEGGDAPSVTRILQATMPAASKFLLDKWQESMIKKLGVAGFSQYQKDTFERGRALHALLANFLLGRGEPVIGQAELSKEVVCNLWKSIQGVIKDKITNVRLVEHTVTHSGMKYRGIVDCVAFYNNELVVVDFKTAEKPKKNVESLFDNPLQVTAYCGAINNDETIPRHVIDRNISSGLVIVAYIDGSAASMYYLESQKVSEGYWKQWVSRLEQYSRLEDLKESKKS